MPRFLLDLLDTSDGLPDTAPLPPTSWEEIEHALDLEALADEVAAAETFQH